MLSCCCFCSSKFQSPRTEHISGPPLLSSLPSESSCLLPCILLLPLLQISPLITEVEIIFDDPWHFPATFLPKYLTGCISHCCIEGGNHGFNVLASSHSPMSVRTSHPSFLEKCKPHLGPSASQDQTLVLEVWLSRLLQTNSKGHHHQVMVTSYVCSRKIPCPMDVNS